MIDDAKIGGITPAMFSFKGKCDDWPQVAALLESRLPAQVPRIVLHGQVCRRELAVEIDGIHA